jgi:hypothetical protein
MCGDAVLPAVRSVYPRRPGPANDNSRQAEPPSRTGLRPILRAGALLPRLSVAEFLHDTLTLDPNVAPLGQSYPNEQDGVRHAVSHDPRPG